jgi:hypothetical protein
VDELVRAVVTIDVRTSGADKARLDEALQVLRAVKGVERLAVVQVLERARWATLEVHLAAKERFGLRVALELLTRAAMRTPLSVAGRSFDPEEMYGHDDAD